MLQNQTLLELPCPPTYRPHPWLITIFWLIIMLTLHPWLVAIVHYWSVDYGGQLCCCFFLCYWNESMLVMICERLLSWAPLLPFLILTSLSFPSIPVYTMAATDVKIYLSKAHFQVLKEEVTLSQGTSRVSVSMPKNMIALEKKKHLFFYFKSIRFLLKLIM